MNFEWSPEQTDLAGRTLRFAGELSAGAAQRDARRTFSAEAFQRCGAFGLLGAPVPQARGGLGLDCLTTALMFESLGRGCEDGGLGLSTGAHTFTCVMPILKFGSEELKERTLPGLVSGERVGCGAMTEPQAGSHISALATRAHRDGEVYRLSGTKAFVTNAPVADVFVVYAAVQPERGFLGIAGFVIERGSPGLTVGPALSTMGLHGSPISEVRLENCVVPAADRLGTDGQGAAIFGVAMDWERTCLFAFWIGRLERQLEAVIERARTRVQFGRPIGVNQAISHRIADMKLRLEAARWLLYRACSDVDRGCVNPLNVSLAKLAVSEAAVQSSLDAVRIFGGAGILTDTGVEEYLRDALPGTIYSGTSEIHRDLVARHLGLPRPRLGRS